MKKVGTGRRLKRRIQEFLIDTVLVAIVTSLFVYGYFKAVFQEQDKLTAQIQTIAEVQRVSTNN